MRKFLVSAFIVILIGLTGLFIARFLFGDDEDTWICANSQWVKHGNPNKPMPITGCGITNGWKTQSVDEVGLTFGYPPDTTFRKEIASDSAGIHVAGFYVEKEGYTLYGVYQPNKEATQADVERVKTEMDPSTIKDVTIGGLKGIEGLIVGPKTRHITVLLKNNRLFTVSTIPPTKENKTLTDEVIATFKFNNQ